MNDLQSASIAEISTALAKAQATMSVAVKDTTGQIGQNRGYKYADLVSVITAAREALAANGLAVIQRPMPSQGSTITLQTMIVHSSGEWISDGGLTLPAQKNDPQGMGSAVTYARRYGLAAMLGIVQDDDDGAAAVAAQQRARDTAAAAPKLTTEQAAILEAVAAKIGRPGRDRSNLLAADFPTHLKTGLGLAVNERFITAAEAEDIHTAGLALDVSTVTNLLASEVAA